MTREHSLFNFGKSRTQQQFKDECDFNKVIGQFIKTGVCSHANPKQPQYIDCVGATDLTHAFALVDAAVAQFAALPAKIRKDHDNDPEKFYAWMEDPANAAEAIKLGLLPPPPAAPPPAPSEPPKDAPKEPQKEAPNSKTT